MNILCQAQLPGNSQSFQIFIDPNSTVLELRKKISERTSVAASELNLVCGKKQLEDYQTIQSYRLKTNSVVFVIYKLPGG
jgi:hypothetical protein